MLTNGGSGISIVIPVAAPELLTISWFLIGKLRGEIWLFYLLMHWEVWEATAWSALVINMSSFTLWNFYYLLCTFFTLKFAWYCHRLGGSIELFLLELVDEIWLFLPLWCSELTKLLYKPDSRPSASTCSGSSALCKIVLLSLRFVGIWIKIFYCRSGFGLPDRFPSCSYLKESSLALPILWW